MKELKIKYKFDSNYNPTYINGAVGGINPQGEIVANFYLERGPIPNSTTFELTTENQLGKIIQNNPDDFQKSLIRFVECGIVLNLNSAKQINQWLAEQISTLEAIQIK
jgi:hypothetical protein